MKGERVKEETRGTTLKMKKIKEESPVNNRGRPKDSITLNFCWSETKKETTYNTGESHKQEWSNMRL